MEALLLEKLNAFILFKNEGMKEALRLYPDQTGFLQANKSKKYRKIRKEILREFLLLKSKRTIIRKLQFNQIAPCQN